MIKYSQIDQYQELVLVPQPQTEHIFFGTTKKKKKEKKNEHTNKIIIFLCIANVHELSISSGKNKYSGSRRQESPH